ncbi:hypothetical protein YYC_03340 [Plasmodium yoelii 17X]|uniref:Uncharacterized protein n=2 Tax=Plasmodium yoelii TaxID=5861 RepID=Q7RPZ2_PLAYO|nr:hypothetical protein [Plasmodium yoelii yoelii]ETB59048.1 hypothetical protein YYC_03340 [Plasmodium yoelii 17X]
MSKFCDTFKILCNIYPNIIKNDIGDKFLDNAKNISYGCILFFQIITVTLENGVLPLIVYQQIYHPSYRKNRSKIISLNEREPPNSDITSKDRETALSPSLVNKLITIVTILLQ